MLGRIVNSQHNGHTGFWLIRDILIESNYQLQIKKKLNYLKIKVLFFFKLFQKLKITKLTRIMYSKKPYHFETNTKSSLSYKFAFF